MDQLSHLLEGHRLFVWGAWLPCLVLLVAEALLVQSRLERARRDAALREEEAAE
jgi:hypothetical protein